MPLQLASFPIVSTEDADEAQSILSREMASLRFRRLNNPNRFRLTMNGIHLGRTMLGWNRFDTEAEIEAGRIEDAVMLTMSFGPATIPIIDGEPVDPGRGAITSPSRHLSVHRAAGSEILILKTDIHAIEQRLQEVMERRPDQPVSFDSSIDLNCGVGLEIRRLLNVTTEQICRGGSVLQYPLLQKSLDDLLLSVLLTLPNSYSNVLSDCGSTSFAPRLVRMAEEYIEAHGTEAIDMSEVAGSCDCSRRTLFSAFRRHRDYTPSQFLMRVRLKMAREALRSPKSGDTVSSIAHRCGFLHAGRFAKIYLERFGESPSQTLRRSHGTLN